MAQQSRFRYKEQILSNILTPLAIWKNFSATSDLAPEILCDYTEEGIRYEEVAFNGRKTDDGTVRIYGVLARSDASPSKFGVIIMADSKSAIRKDLLKFFTDRGYAALQVDYAGEREGVEKFTKYPASVGYANDVKSGRYKYFVDENAEKTSWYEWTAVGIYAKKYLEQRLGGSDIGLIGIRDGGEIAWKLAVAEQFSCAVMISACGWKAYEGYGKFENAEPKFDDERYRFVAGIDSQAYAPYVRCPVLMLCTTNDPEFDYDRAYDTFSRINPEYQGQSAITYSVNCDCRVDTKSTQDLFMYLDSFVKGRRVFIPKPVEMGVVVDEKSNLVIKASCDELGILEDCGVYVAEDCAESAYRSWAKVPFKRNVNSHEREFFVNIYEKTKLLFILGYAVYSNGFTVWSKLTVKKISGKFRNSRAKSRIMYSVKGSDSFGVGDLAENSVGGVFIVDGCVMPKLVQAQGLNGIYSPCGLYTSRSYSPQFAPDADSILRFDICPDVDGKCAITLDCGKETGVYRLKVKVVGGVWQKIILESKLFKNADGMPLESFAECRSITLMCGVKYALNNLMWL